MQRTKPRKQLVYIDGTRMLLLKSLLGPFILASTHGTTVSILRRGGSCSVERCQQFSLFQSCLLFLLPLPVPEVGHLLLRKQCLSNFQQGSSVTKNLRTITKKILWDKSKQTTNLPKISETENLFRQYWLLYFLNHRSQGKIKETFFTSSLFQILTAQPRYWALKCGSLFQWTLQN